MEENITYAEMNLTTGKGKRQGKTNTVHLQDEDLGVTYAAVKKPPGKKKEKSSKRQKGSDPPQNKEIGITYAAIRKNTNPKPPPEDLKKGEDRTVTYAALMETTKKKSRKYGETQEGQCKEKTTEDTCVIIRGDQKPTGWKQRFYPGVILTPCAGGRWAVLLVPVLVTLCMILLITTINGARSGETPRNGSGSAISPPADSSSPCPDSWILITDKCYFFSENRKNRGDSEKDCEERNSRLATVKEGTILKLVTITDQGFWIGLFSLGSHHDGGTWSGRWADGSVVNVTSGSGTCAKIHRVLQLSSCVSDLHWICERNQLTWSIVYNMSCPSPPNTEETS